MSSAVALPAAVRTAVDCACAPPVPDGLLKEKQIQIETKEERPRAEGRAEAILKAGTCTG